MNNFPNTVAATPTRLASAPYVTRASGVTVAGADAANARAKPLADAIALHEAAGNLVAALTRSGGKWSTNACFAEEAALEAANELWPDEPLSEHLEIVRDSLPEEPVEAEFNPSLRHPDAEIF